MTDRNTDEEFAPIAAAMKELPYFAPSPHFADKVMARVRVGTADVPVEVKAPAVEPARIRALPERYSAPLAERRSHALASHGDLRRSIPARIAAAALVASAGMTMAAVALVALFNVDLFLLVSRVFGQGTMSFLATLAADVSATATSTAAGAAASAGTAAGAAVIGSFAAGVIAATAGLRAAASASRRAA